MPRRPDPSAASPERRTDAPARFGSPAGSDTPAGFGAPAMPSLAGLGIAGVSRRRVAWAVLAIVAAWIVLGFAGQAATSARAGEQAAVAATQKAEAVAETAALHRELELVIQDRWILQQARAYQLGSRHERPFALAPGAPDLPPSAPGSAARRLGAEVEEVSPIEAWLEVLFGPRS